MNTEFHPLTITAVIPLNKDSIQLKFEVPNELQATFKYVQGQHLTLKAMINGEDVRRSYSICSNVLDQQLEVAIKQIDHGVFSSYAKTQLKPGMSLEVMSPQGHFYTELNAGNKKNYLLLASGSGITPILSHILSILASEPQSRVTLVYGNQSMTQMMFKEKLNFIKNENMTRFNWVNLFTREEQESIILNGRISTEKIKALHNANILEVNKYDDVFICGPESMIKEVSTAFLGWGFNDDQIHYELFFIGNSEQVAKKKQQQRTTLYGHNQSHVSLKVAGRKKQIVLSIDGTNILDAALEQGIDLPFSCKGGVCATCKAKVTSGKVEMDSNHSLTDEEISEGMVLTCQAHPLSENVEIDFDFN